MKQAGQRALEQQHPRLTIVSNNGYKKYKKLSFRSRNLILTAMLRLSKLSAIHVNLSVAQEPITTYPYCITITIAHRTMMTSRIS